MANSTAESYSVAETTPDVASEPVKAAPGPAKSKWQDIFAIMDQGSISAARFITTLLIGSYCGAAQLGIYSVGMTVVLLLQTIHEALLIVPFSVAKQSAAPDERASLHTDALGQHLTFSGLMTMVVAIGGITLTSWRPDVLPFAAAVCLAVPAILLGEYVRRYYLAEMNGFMPMCMSGAIAAVQVLSLGGLALTENLNAALAFTIMGSCWLAGALCWLGFMPSIYRRPIRWQGVKQRFGQFWQTSRWLVASQSLAQLYFHTPVWILAVSHGDVEAGHLAAYMCITKLLNPFILGLGARLCPRLAREEATGGSRQVRWFVVRYSLVMISVIVVYGFALLFLADLMLQRLFDIQPTYPISVIVLLLTMHAGLGAVSMALYHGLNAVRASVVNMQINAVALTTCLLVTLFSVPAWGAVGVIVALLGGTHCRRRCKESNSGDIREVKHDRNVKSCTTRRRSDSTGKGVPANSHCLHVDADLDDVHSDDTRGP